MDKQLAFQIREAIESNGDAIDLYDVICSLSTHEKVTATLLDAYAQVVRETERLWTGIEQRPDYRYQSREQAVNDFYKTHV